MILDRCAGKVDHVVAVSNGVQRKVCNGFSSSVIYSGCDTAHLARSVPRDEFRARFGLKPDDFVVGSVMRLTPGKNPELLIEAIARLPRRYKLFLVGWGALQQKLLYLANEIAPMRCIIAAAEENLGDYYAAFDAFCLPSDSEGFGLASLEALFCGVPVVTTRTGFPPELLTSGVHYLQCASQPESIARALVRLRKHPQWAAGIAAEGRRAAERFGFASRMCRQYEDLLVRLWNERTGGRTAAGAHTHNGNGSGASETGASGTGASGTSGNGASRDPLCSETADGSATGGSETCGSATCGDEASRRDRLGSEACSGNGECG
jgi:glycosyltransferase involved in cell wall biosynthesis